MSSKKEIIQKHLNNINNLKKHNKSYYLFDKPTISDSKYDRLKIESIEIVEYY